MADRTCIVCCGAVSGRSDKKYCSRECGSKAFHAARKADGRLAAQSPQSEQRAAYMAENRSRWYRFDDRSCKRCGAAFQTRVDRDAEFCSRLCSTRTRLETAPPRPSRPPRLCARCSGVVEGGAKYCADCRVVVRSEVARSQRSELGRAFEDRDAGVLMAALGRLCEPDGVHLIWKGRCADGYPVATLLGTRMFLHRAVAAVFYGEPGAMPVHHTCGHSRCLNPEHLQIVTPIENTAEMLERQWYLERIKNLEDALAKVAPGHKLLAVPLLGADPRLWDRMSA